jgi:hypothetical protein
MIKEKPKKFYFFIPLLNKGEAGQAEISRGW